MNEITGRPCIILRTETSRTAFRVGELAAWQNRKHELCARFRLDMTCDATVSLSGTLYLSLPANGEVDRKWEDAVLSIFAELRRLYDRVVVDYLASFSGRAGDQWFAVAMPRQGAGGDHLRDLAGALASLADTFFSTTGQRVEIDETALAHLRGGDRPLPPWSRAYAMLNADASPAGVVREPSISDVNALQEKWLGMVAADEIPLRVSLPNLYMSPNADRADVVLDWALACARFIRTLEACGLRFVLKDFF
jgi:hypothetical protein